MLKVCVSHFLLVDGVISLFLNLIIVKSCFAHFIHEVLSALIVQSIKNLLLQSVWCFSVPFNIVTTSIVRNLNGVKITLRLRNGIKTFLCLIHFFLRLTHFSLFILQLILVLFQSSFCVSHSRLELINPILAIAFLSFDKLFLSPF